MDITKYLDTWAAAYRNDLIENIMPFWMKFGLDRKHGGIYTCLDRDGQINGLHKIGIGFRGVSVLLHSYAYNHIEKKQEWLAASKSCIDFIETHCT